jgi:hypothetical protein
MTPPARDERRWTIYVCSGCNTMQSEDCLCDPKHAGYNRPLGVMPVAAHKAALAAARHVDEASQRIVRHIAGMIFPESGHPYGSIPRQLVYDARSALTVPEPEERR